MKGPVWLLSLSTFSWTSGVGLLGVISTPRSEASVCMTGPICLVWIIKSWCLRQSLAREALSPVGPGTAWRFTLSLSAAGSQRWLSYDRCSQHVAPSASPVRALLCHLRCTWHLSITPPPTTTPFLSFLTLPSNCLFSLFTFLSRHFSGRLLWCHSGAAVRTALCSGGENGGPFFFEKHLWASRLIGLPMCSEECALALSLPSCSSSCPMEILLELHFDVVSRPHTRIHTTVIMQHSDVSSVCFTPCAEVSLGPAAGRAPLATTR